MQHHWRHFVEKDTAVHSILAVVDEALLMSCCYYHICRSFGNYYYTSWNYFLDSTRNLTQNWRNTDYTGFDQLGEWTVDNSLNQQNIDNPQSYKDNEKPDKMDNWNDSDLVLENNFDYRSLDFLKEKFNNETLLSIIIILYFIHKQPDETQNF